GREPAHLLIKQIVVEAAGDEGVRLRQLSLITGVGEGSFRAFVSKERFTRRAARQAHISQRIATRRSGGKLQLRAAEETDHAGLFALDGGEVRRDGTG